MQRGVATGFRSSLAVVALAALLTGCGGGDNEGSVTPAASRVRALSAGDTTAILINEVHSANWSGARDEDGDAEDWVELYNPTPTTADLGQWGLSNKVASPFRWLIPSGTTLAPGQYLRIWLSKKNRSVPGRPLHASFNLDNGGDALYLSAPDAAGVAVRIDGTTPPQTRTDMSWCRMPSGQATSPFVHCASPTPGAANSGEASATLLAKPAMSVTSGLYTASQTVTLTGPAGAQIRYTLDGEEPGPGSALYSTPLTIGSSTVLRAAAFPATPGAAIASYPETQTYVIDAAAGTRYAGQRVAFVTMRPGDVPVFNAKTKDVAFRTHVELLSGTRAVQLRADADSDVAGQNGSLTSPTTSLDVTLRDALGVKSVKTSLWPEKPGVTAVKKFRLRNGSNDWAGAHLRDQYAQSFAAGGPNLYASSSTVAMFLNGRYYGMMDLREKETDTLPESNLGGDRDNVDYIDNPGIGEEENKGAEGGTARYKAMLDWVLANDMSVPANYARAKTLLHPESLIHTFALHFNVVRGAPWPSTNTRAWRNPEFDGRWQWHPHDLDSSVGRGGETTPATDIFPVLANPGGELFLALLRAPEFRNLFINVLCDQMNHAFLPTRAVARLDTMAAEMRPYVSQYFATIGQGSLAAWEEEIDDMREFMRARPAYTDQYTRAYFGLAERKTVTLAVNDDAMGTVQVNTLNLTGVLTTGMPWSGRYYPSVPITLKAVPKPGYVFVGWQGASSATAAVITHTLAADASFTAQFAPLASPAAPVIASPGSLLNATGELVDLQLAATDAQGYPVTWSAKKLPNGVGLYGPTGKLYGRTTTPGTFATELTATNGKTASTVTISWVVQDAVFSGALASYWPNTTFTGSPAVVRSEPLAMSLPSGVGPAPGLPTSGFVVRWDSVLTATRTGEHVLQTISSGGDGLRLWLDNQLLIDNWSNPQTQREATVSLTAGTRYALRVEFTDAGSDAVFALNWKLPGSTQFVALTQAALGLPANQAPVVTAPAARLSAIGQSEQFTVQGSDPELRALTWSASELPPGMSIAAATGLVSGTPTTAGTWRTTVTATDPSGASGSASFDWTVTTGLRLVNGSFENPALADATFVIAPTNVPSWTFVGSSALSSAGSGFTKRAPAFPDSRQVVALQNTSGRISQALALRPGDVLSLQATQRVNVNTTPQRLGVYVDGVQQGALIQPPSGAWQAYQVALSIPVARTATLELRGTVGGVGVDSTVLVDGLAVNGSSGPSEILLPQGGFEQPVLAAASFQYAPAGTAWSFTGAAGVSTAGSGFTLGAAPIPEGAQLAFVQRRGQVAQTVALQPGDRLRFTATQRANFGNGPQTLRVFVAGVAQGDVLTPTSGSWTDLTVPLSVAAAGNYLVEIRGLTTAPGDDRTAFIDQVRLLR